MRFLAAQGDPLEAFEFADALFDPGAAFVEEAEKESRFCESAVAVRDYRADAALARGLAIGFAVVALVADDGARRYVGADVEQDREISAVAGFATGQVEGQGQAAEIGFQVDFGRKAAARAPEGLAILPPFFAGGRDMRANHRRIEHLNQVRGRADQDATGGGGGDAADATLRRDPRSGSRRLMWIPAYPGNKIEPCYRGPMARTMPIDDAKRTELVGKIAQRHGRCTVSALIVLGDLRAL